MLGHIVPYIVVDEYHVRADDVVGQDNVLYNFVEFIAVEGGQRILLTVNSSCLQRHVKVINIHRSCGCSPGLYHFYIQIRFRNTDLKTLQIIQRMDFLVGCQLSCSIIEGSEDTGIHAFKFFVQRILVLSVHCLLGIHAPN